MCGTKKYFKSVWLQRKQPYSINKQNLFWYSIAISDIQILSKKVFQNGELKD